MSDESKQLLFFILTMSNITVFICSAVLYGNPFKPIITLVLSIFKGNKSNKN